jgi:YD repeat-containing protein
LSFTQVALTGQVTLPGNVPAGSATVSLTLNKAITDGVEVLDATPITAVCSHSGAFTLTVAANDDPTTLPPGSFYNVVVLDPAGRFVEAFAVVVSRADAPTANLFTIEQAPATQWPYVITFQGRTGTVALTKDDVLGTGLAAADLGASTSGAVGAVAAAVVAETDRAEGVEAAKMSASTTLDQVPGAAADVALHGHRLTGVADATAATDALNRETADGRYDAAGAAATAVGVETARAEAAEALLSKSSPATTITRNADESIASITDADGVTDTLTYDAGGNLVSYRFQGTVHTITRDAAGNVTAVS